MCDGSVCILICRLVQTQVEDREWRTRNNQSEKGLQLQQSLALRMKFLQLLPANCVFFFGFAYNMHRPSYHVNVYLCFVVRKRKTAI